MDELTLALARFPLQDYLVQHGADRDGKEWRLDCPRCRKPHLTVSTLKGQWRCFTCERYHALTDHRGRKIALDGAGGTFTLVQWLENCDPRTAAQLIIARSRRPAGELVSCAPPVERGGQVQKIPTGLPPNAVDLDGTVPYMDRRGITLADFKQFGMRYVPRDGSWLQDRLLFPVWEAGRVLYWQARACWDAAEHRERWAGDRFRKSLNPASERNGVRYLGSSDVLGNLEQASRYPRVAIVEGPTSGIRTGPDAVWTFGKQLSPAQVARLIHAGVRGVDFMWDGPSSSEPHGAWPQMVQSAASLAAAGLDVRMVFLPRGDPGEYPRDHLWWYRQHAPPYQGSTL
jgi:hypothetical protein